MEAITYSLRDKAGISDQYYQDIGSFTDEVLDKSWNIWEMMRTFRLYLLKTKRETVRSKGEYCFDILMLGTLWRCYSYRSLSLPNMPRKLLAKLADLRSEVTCLKPGADLLRGILATLYLSDNNKRMAPLVPTLDNLDSLIRWIEATGEYRQEANRMKIWRDFLATCNPQEISEYLSIAIDFAAWFEDRSEAALGRYTARVEPFLSEVGQNHRWKEDIIFCGRQRVEYHLNMVGAEIMTRTNRDAFLRASQKEILVPACMRSRPDGQCKARATEDGARCAGCTPDCRVHQLAKMGKEQGFGVLIISHESSAFAKRKEDEDIGIVGIACVSNLISGGFKAKDLGIPAQCVILDYCGCKNHWHKEGFPTEININQLKRIMGVWKASGKQEIPDLIPIPRQDPYSLTLPSLRLPLSPDLH